MSFDLRAHVDPTEARRALCFITWATRRLLTFPRCHLGLGCDDPCAAGTEDIGLTVVDSLHLLDARRLPRAFAGRENGRRLRLGPVETHDKVDCVIRSR